MKRSTHWLVADEGINPDADPDRCQFCLQQLGHEHKEGCIIRERTVLVDIKLQMVVILPEDWSAQVIEDGLSGRTRGACVNGTMEVIKVAHDRMMDHDRCMCGGKVEVRFVREATEEDEERYGIRVNELPS